MSTKEQVWLEEYLKCWNATEAARRAGYAWPNKQGPQKKEKLAKDISQRIAERAMSADEVLDRLGEQARGDIANALTIDGNVVMIDMAKLKELGLTHLVKKIKHNPKGGIELEFYDAQAALVHLGKAHGIFVDKTQIDGDITLKVVYSD